MVVHSQSPLTVFEYVSFLLKFCICSQDRAYLHVCTYICTRRNWEILFWYVMYLFMLEDEIFHLKVEQSLGLGLGWGTFSISKSPRF